MAEHVEFISGLDEFDTDAAKGINKIVDLYNRAISRKSVSSNDWREAILDVREAAARKLQALNEDSTPPKDKL